MASRPAVSSTAGPIAPSRTGFGAWTIGCETVPSNLGRKRALRPAQSYTADPGELSCTEGRHLSGVPMERAGQPSEVAPSCLFLALDDSSYMTGQNLHPNGGEIINR